MTMRANATAVGAFVLGALAIAVGIVIVFGGGLLNRDVSHYVVFFEGSLEGLAVGAPVKFRGVKVGQVVSITPTLAKDVNDVHIPVVIELNRDSVAGLQAGDGTLRDLVQEGLRARLELESIITGQLFVGLDLYKNVALQEVANPTGYIQIPSIPSLQYGLQQSLTNLLADRPKLELGLSQALELLNAMVANGGAEQLATTMRSAAALSQKLADPAGPLFRTLDGLPPLLDEINRATAGVPPLLDQAGKVMASANGLVAGDEAPAVKTLADLQATLVSLRGLSDQLSAMVGQLRAPVVGFAQTGLPNLGGLIEDMDRAVGEISRTVRDLRQNPTQFLLGDSAARGVKLQ